MPRKTLLLVSLALAALSVMLVLAYAMRVRQEADPGRLVKVVVARKTLRSGEVVNEKNVATGFVPARFIHSDAIDLEKVNFETIQGQKITAPVKEGDYLLWRDFGEEQLTTPPLSSVIKKGERAMTLQVNQTNSFGGMINPNDHVDILGTFTRITGEGAREKVTITLLQDVTVLAVDNRIGRDVSGKPFKTSGRAGTVTVLVSPEDAELITFAQTQTSFQLLLRNPDDLEIREDLPERGLTSLFEEGQRSQIRAQQKEWRDKMRKIEIIRTK